MDKNLIVHEDVLGLYSLSGIGQTAEVITSCLKDVLIRCNLSFGDLHGQGYDGASAMAGNISGVAKRVKAFAPHAHFVHCLAHCLNLAMSDAGKSVPLLQAARDVTHKLVSFVHSSSCKRRDVFTCILQSDSDNITVMTNSFVHGSQSPHFSLTI